MLFASRPGGSPQATALTPSHPLARSAVQDRFRALTLKNLEIF
jgi:hypothetical protein